MHLFFVCLGESNLFVLYLSFFLRYYLPECDLSETYFFKRIKCASEHVLWVFSAGEDSRFLPLFGTFSFTWPYENSRTLARKEDHARDSSWFFLRYSIRRLVLTRIWLCVCVFGSVESSWRTDAVLYVVHAGEMDVNWMQSRNCVIEWNYGTVNDPHAENKNNYIVGYSSF